MSRRVPLIAFALIFVSSLFIFSRAKASHASGAELVYEWVSDSTYRFYYKFYRDCSGVSAPNGIDMCYHSDCATGITYSAILQQISYLPGGFPNGTTVNTECPGFPSRCNDVSGTAPNYAEWWYTCVITLPHNCDTWYFEATTSARNVNVNLDGSSQALHVITTFNSITAPGNNSPQFSVKPVSFACINQAYTYNNGVTDPDGDSLSFELVQPLEGFNCVATPISFASGSPAYNLTNNPFQTNNSFTLDAATGQMNFTPALQGANVVALRAKEYRNGQLIGSVMRDVQLNIRPCTNTLPVFTLLPGTVQGAQYVNGQILACSEQPVSFCFKLKGATPGTILVATDNHTISAPGSSVTYNGLQTDSVYGCFSWIPGPLDTGLTVLTITGKDSVCASPGIVLSQTFTIPLYISPSTTILRDTVICQNQTAQLFAYGGSQFTWSALPGGSGISSLSCVQCRDPVASPTVTTSYVVTSNLQNVCGKNKDTVTVTVNQQQAPATPVVTSNSAVCVGSTLQFSTGNVPGVIYEWTGPSGFTSQLQNPAINNAQLFHSGIYTLQLSQNGCRSLPATIPAYVKTPPEILYNTASLDICEGQPISLDVSGSVPVTYQWTGPNSFSSTDSFIYINAATMADSGVYTVTISDGGCLSDPLPIPVVVHALPAAPVAVSPVVYCQYSQAAPLAASGSNLTWYTSPGGQFGTPVAPIPNTGTPGSHTWYVSSTANGCLSALTPVTVIVYQQPGKPSYTAGSLCQGAAAGPISVAGQNIKWYTQPTGGNYTTTAPTPATVVPGTQTWYVSQTVNGCESERLQVMVTIVPRPQPPVTDSVYYCLGSIPVPLTAQGQALQWYTSAAGGQPLTTAPVPNTSTTGTQTWYVSQTVNGCESIRAPLVVSVLPAVAATVSVSRDTVCAFDTLTVRNTAAAAPASQYIWSFDNATVHHGNEPYILSWSTAGIKNIVLQVYNAGCATADTVRVNVMPVPASSFSLLPDACIGQLVQVQPGRDVPQNGLSCNWSFSGGNVFSGTGWGPYLLSWSSPGTKTISLVTDNGHCISPVFYDTIHIHDFPEVKINSIHGNTICSGDPVNFSSVYKPGYHYMWTPAHYFSGQDAASVTVPVTLTGIIGLVVTDAYGCTAADSTLIETKPCCTVSLPDAFTPNGDGRNDLFHILTAGHHQLSTFRILNRWGQTVFETADEHRGWDGTLGGVQQETGTYFYFLKYKCADGGIYEQKGSLTLLR